MLSFFPRGVLDEIFNLIESVSEDFPSYFCSIFRGAGKFCFAHGLRQLTRDAIFDVSYLQDVTKNSE